VKQADYQQTLSNFVPVTTTLKPVIKTTQILSWLSSIYIILCLVTLCMAILATSFSLLAMSLLILMDAVIPLDHVATALERFIVLQQHHLDYEEATVFPLLRQTLTEDDWRHLEHNWVHMTGDDPLFGRQVAERYHDLATQLLSA
jgi:hypothetical protein